MFTCKVKNSIGKEITLTQRESEYQIISVEGLNPPSAQINTTEVVNLDGARYNSSRLGTRQIVLSLKLNGNVEQNRLRLYQYFPTQEPCEFYYKNDSRDVYIEGYVQSVEVSPFDKSEVMQIAILCMNPYFKALEDIIDNLSATLAGFAFPFAIDYDDPIEFSTIEADKVTVVTNNSESVSGCKININVQTPCSKIMVRNVATGDFFALQGEFETGDEILVNTQRGNKSARLLRDAAYSNLFLNIVPGSVFFQLEKGENSFAYQVNDSSSYNGYVEVSISHRLIYRGV